jgi:hypothetical protein
MVLSHVPCTNRSFDLFAPINQLMKKESDLDLESERVGEWGFSVDFKNYDYPLD